MTIAPMNDAQKVAFYESLQELIDASGPNKHHQAIMAIEACISEGIVTKEQIIGVGIRMGFVRGHIANMLKDPANAHRWRVDRQGNVSPRDPDI